ncbi:BppU family phage baseplate upper protein [Bacillus toyonensis]|uniref:BppU family phage baseplate upper protein n=1 Tax=Bacillus toyonensis TaxID=155322 RepID=UPI00211D4336|nr:BppU family phage baseplate upper protein [Bacillus toyonensis]
MKIKLVLDINKTQQAQLNAVVTGRQGDKATVTVNVFVVDGGVPYNLTGNTIYYEGLKPNNAYVRDTSGVKIINATQGNFEYTFRPETFGVAGVGKRSYFSIEQGGTVRASTQDFGLVTLADAMTGHTMSGPYISELEELIQQAQLLVDDINSRWTAINTQLTQLQNKLNGMDVVKRSGDTMTGNLNFQTKDGAKMLQWYNDQTQLGRLVFHPSGLVEWFGRNGATETGAWNYSPATNTFNVVSNTNLVKKTEAYTELVQPNGDTININGQNLDSLQKPGSYGGNNLGSSPDGTTAFFYVDVVRYSDRSYVKQIATVLAGTRAFTWTRKMTGANVWNAWDRHALNDDVLKKAGDTATGNMTFNGVTNLRNNVEHVLQANTDKGVSIVINDSQSKWSVGPKMAGAVDWQKELTLNLNTGVVTVAALSTKLDGSTIIPLSAEATGPDVNYPLMTIRRNSTVELKGAVVLNANATGVIVATLPSDLRPTGGNRSIYTPTSDGTAMVQVFINGTTGAVALSTNAKGKRVDFTLTYLV